MERISYKDRVELLKKIIRERIESYGYFQKLKIWSIGYNLYLEYENVYNREHKIKYGVELYTFILDADYNPTELFREDCIDGFCRQVAIEAERNEFAIVTIKMEGKK